MSNNERLNNLLTAVEATFGRGKSSNWKNRDFEALSLAIIKKTKIVISPLTLKRIFGKIKTAEDYLPQKATINALETYAEATLTNNTNENKDENIIISEKEIDRRAKFYLILVISIIILSTIGVLIQKKISSHSQVKYELKFLKSDGVIPQTGYFEYDIPDDNSDYAIQFDQNFPAIKAKGGKRNVSYYYQYPGLFKVKVLKGESIITDTIPVFVPTIGWLCLASYLDQEQTDRYYPLNLPNFKRNNCYHFSANYLNVHGVDTTKIVVVDINNFHKTGVNGDNFDFSAKFKNSDQWSGVRCNTVSVKIFGKEGDVFFSFTNPGCSHWVRCYLSEKTPDVSNNRGLQNLTFNLSEWQNIRIENSNKKVQLYINDLVKFEESYAKSIGEIIGLKVSFHGSGYLQSIKLESHSKILFEL